MLGASINYPLRGAVTWKSIVGTNVAADALSNLASPGVMGGAHDHPRRGLRRGRERHPGALLRLCDEIVDVAARSAARPADRSCACVEKGFELSEASHAPVMMELRIRACHVTGEFIAKDNRRPRSLRRQPPARPAHVQLCAPRAIRRSPSSTRSSRSTSACRRRRSFIRAEQAQRGASRRPRRHRHHRAGRPAPTACCARSSGSASPTCSATPASRSIASMSPIRWCPRRCASFCAGKRAVLIVEEGAPDYIEQAINTELRRADIQTTRPRQGRAAQGRRIHHRRADRAASPASSPRPGRAGVDTAAIVAAAEADRGAQGRRRRRGRRMPARPPTFCTGCPERPVFAAIKLRAARDRRRRTSLPTSAATRSRPSRRSAWATRSSATACRSRAPPAVGAQHARRARSR